MRFVLLQFDSMKSIKHNGVEVQIQNIIRNKNHVKFEKKFYK